MKSRVVVLWREGGTKSVESLLDAFVPHTMGVLKYGHPGT
jgi:hypothetical protein